jgi:hypothetical protein
MKTGYLSTAFSFSGLGLALALFVAPPPVSGAGGQCTMDPEEGKCCVCQYGEETACHGETERGGVQYCNDQICPIDIEPCWGEGN